ncbi:MAG: hypothetical protein V3U87_07400 [Methylococcaceae bacterium]
MARDNFNKPVIEKLKARVSLRCSNPDCRVPTSAPSSNDSINNIGIAAHICAASPGGARYSKSMTTEERKSIDNAIWLCSNCSIEIDRDENRYAVGLLKGWKEKAEDSARVELGKKMSSDSETIDTVAAALTGFPKSYIANAISNVHQASGKALESLDPRFLVKTSHDEGKTSIEVHAKENVSLTMKINSESAREYMDMHRQLIEHGKDVEIKSNAISFEGSKLFEEIFGKNNEGVLNISGKKLQATQKLWLLQKGTNVIESFDDIQGTISFGTKSFSFNGKTCKNIFSFSYQKSLDESDNKADINISLCLDLWEGTNLRFVPYLAKISSLFSKMAQGWEIFTSLEINGIKVISSVGMKVDKWNYVLDTNSFLHYVNCCKTISEALKYNINYTSNISYTIEEHENISDIAEVFEGKQVYLESNITGNATCELVVDGDNKNVRLLTELTEPISMKMVQSVGESVKLFDVEVNLPKK